MKDMEYWRQRATCGRERGREQLIILLYPTLTSYIQKIISYNCKNSPTMHTTQNSRPFQQFKCHTSAPTWAWFRQRKGCRCEGHMPEIFRNTGRACTWVLKRLPLHVRMPPGPQQFGKYNGSTPSQAKPGRFNLCTPGCPTQRPLVFNKTD